MSNEEIKHFLDRIKTQGKVSPDGAYWHDFFLFLQKHKQAGEEDPPVPLILAASYSSPAKKHTRLFQQLVWAMNNNILDQAIDYLNRLKYIEWTTSSEAGWDSDKLYWEDME